MKRALPLLLCILVCFNFVQISANDGPSSYYKTNPTLGKKVSSPIVIDGTPSGWTQDMLIVQGVANDGATAFRGAHEGPVYDLYQLYAAWDDTNIYLMWQITNVTDIASPGQDFPHSDNGKPWNGDIPFQIAFDIDPSTGTNAMLSGKTIEGVADSHVWGVFNVFPNNNVDKLLMFSSKPGVGQPAVFNINSQTGSFDYNNVTSFAQAGIEYKWGDYCVPTEIWGINRDEHVDFAGDTKFEPSDLSDESLYVDFIKLGHKTSMETIYEMKIPLSALGIDANYLESEGIGVMLISTFGQSGINSLPFDPTTIDNATVPYGPDAATSHEKEDVDRFTVEFARIAKGGGPVIERPALTVSPAGGTYIGGVEVTLTATGTKAPINIYYTLDGSTPSAASTSIVSGGKINITNNNTELKVIAIDADNVASFIQTHKYITEQKPEPEGGITVSFKKPTEWGSNPVYIWAWKDGNINIFDSWPGVTMTDKGDNWYSYTFDKDITSINVIFSNNANPQSIDIKGITATTCYEMSGSAYPFEVNVVNCPTSGISISDTSDNITLYPNPTSDIIRISGISGNNNIRIMSVDGSVKKLVKDYSDGQSIDASTLVSGIYLIKISDINGKESVLKFVKK